jgi:hypothetical protein
MGLEVNRGYAQYNEPGKSQSLRSLSAKRAHIIMQWQRLHPNAERIFRKADASVEKTFGKIRSYNETISGLEARIKEVRKGSEALPLVAILKRVSNLEGAAKKRLGEQANARNRLANMIYAYEAELAPLDEDIAIARLLQRGR